MKYCQLTTYTITGAPAPTGFPQEHQVPVICNDSLYNPAVESPGATVSILAAKADGYDAQADMFEMVAEKIGFLPHDICIEPCYQNSAAASDAAFQHYNSTVFQIDDREYNSDLSYFDKGGNDWSFSDGRVENNVNVPHATGGFTMESMQRPIVGGLSASWRTYAGVDHYDLTFYVFPEAFITSGVYNMAALSESPNHTGDLNWRLYVKVTVSMWSQLYDGVMKYNCFIDVVSSDRHVWEWNLYMVGIPTGTIHDPNDPMPGDQNNNNEGGNGNGDNINDPVTIPVIPSSDMTTSGSLRIYSMSAADIKSMFDYLHANDPGTSIVKWWSNPIQGIISIHYLPYPVKLKAGGSEAIKILGLNTGVSANPAEQFQTIHFGYYDLALDSKSYLDYSPYTKVSIYLPGIGIRELNTDDVMGQRIWVVYHCDNVTGQFMAYVSVGASEAKSSVKYTFSGQVAAAFPISQENWGNTFIAGATLAAGALATGVVAAGAGAAAGGGAAAGSAAGTAAGAAEAGAAGGVTASGIAGGAVNVGNSLANLAKPTISRSGTVSGTTSLFAVKKPYLIVERPNYQAGFNLFAQSKGYPCGKFFKFDDLDGYAVIESVELSGIPATVVELNEIESLLKSGVHF